MTENENPYKNKRKHLWIIVGLVVFNLVGYNLLIRTDGFGMRREYVPDGPTEVMSSLLTFLFTLPIISIVIGLLVGVFPYKKQPFRRRHERASILVLLSINFIFALLLIANLVMIAMGWYPQEPARLPQDGMQVEVGPWTIDDGPWLVDGPMLVNSPRTTVHSD